MEEIIEPKAIELSPPYAPEMIDLNPADENAHGGVSIEDGTAEVGFEVIMLAYLHQTEGDGLRLYRNDELVANTTIKKGEEAVDTSLFIPARRFLSGLNKVRFGIKRSSQAEVPTPDLVLFYRSAPPGGTPPVMTLKASHTSVGPDEADKFVLTVAYNKANWYDRIHVDCAGETVSHQLVPQPTSPLPPVPASIEIPIARAVLEQAGDSAEFKFTFFVTDYLTNSSPTSLPLPIDVHLQRQQLPVAVLREILADNSDNPAEVDLGKMNGGPLWALLYLADTIWQPQDFIHLKFTSVVSGEVAEHEETLPKKELLTQFNWKIPNPNVKPDSDVEMFYEQIRDGKVVGRSITAVAKVTGEPTIEPPSGKETWENEPVNTTFPLHIPVTIKSGLTVTSLSPIGNCFISAPKQLLVAKHCGFSWKDQGKTKVTVLLTSFWHNVGNTVSSHDINGHTIQTFNTSDAPIIFIGSPNRLIHSITIKASDQEPDIGGFCTEIAWE